MRVISAAGVLLLAGCTSAVHQQPTGILRPRYEVMQINGTVEPVAFAVERRKVRTTAERAPCQTNDPMPTGEFLQPPPPMLSDRTPSTAAPIPNYCPVTAPVTTQSTRVSTPRGPKQVQPPAPSEPRP